jgi:hypothetical protein
MRIDGWLPGCGGGAVRGWAEAADDDEDAGAAETVRDTVAEDGADALAVEELADEITLEAGALSPADTLGMMRLAELDEVEEDGSNVTVREAGFAAAFGAGFLSFAMICLLLPRLGESCS